ncbi:MAG TPA: hypothetical protein VGR22_01445, partial [Thermomicrobiales bacterium]|nr:hypothetical protein [Thermomicrobiales bacterium]
MEAALTTSPIGLRPSSRQTLERSSPELARTLSDLSRYLEEQGLASRWPFPVGGLHLFLVLRQWVQEDANETLANQMLSNKDWCQAETMLRKRL